MKGKQRARCDAEILAARLAAPARRAGRTAAVIDNLALAFGADRLAARRGPADADEGCFDFLIRHAQDRAQGERPGLG